MDYHLRKVYMQGGSEAAAGLAREPAVLHLDLVQRMRRRPHTPAHLQGQMKASAQLAREAAAAAYSLAATAGYLGLH